MPSLNTGNAILSNPIKVDSSYNVGIGGAASGSFKLQVTGTTNLTGALTGTSATLSTNLGVGISPIGSFKVSIQGDDSFPHIRLRNTTTRYRSDFTLLNTGELGLNCYDDTAATYMPIKIEGSKISILQGNVGIGTSSPQSSLHVAGAIGEAPTGDGVQMGIQSSFAVIHLNGAAGAGGLIDFSTSGTDYKGRIEYSNSSDFMRFGTNGAERMRITSGGNVGIGTSSPTGKLHLKASTSSDIVLRFEQQNDITSQYYFNIDSAVNGTLSLITNYLGGAVTGFTQDRSGRVGIGTSSPTARLSIQGTGTYNSTSFGPTATVNIRSNEFTNDTWNSVLNIALIRQSLTTGSSSYGGIGFTTIDDSNAAEITDAARIAITNDNPSSTTSPTSMSFWTNTGGTAGNAATERMRITSGGQVQIKQGTNTFSDGLRLINSANAYWGLVAGGDTNLYLGYNSPTISVGVFSSSTGVYTPLSDINKKKDFEQSTIGLNAILGLKPTLYKMKTDDNSVEKHLGFIAQEVKEFIPQAFVESGEDENKFIGLNYNAIVAALVKSVQEQQAQIEAQQQQINSLINR